MTSVKALSRESGYSLDAIRLRRDKFGLPEKFDGRKVVLLAPLDGGTASDQMTLEKARTELALQQARKAKVVADLAEGSVIALEDARADFAELLDTIASTVKASGMAKKAQADLFATIRKGGEAFEAKYGIA